MKTPREILLKRHQTVEPKLDRMWNKSLAPAVAAVCDRRDSKYNLFLAAGWALWRELVLPSRRVWAGLACAWVLIAVLNLASAEPATKAVSQAKPPSGEELRALIEQRRMLAQLIGPLSEPVYPQKRTAPGPRSERAAQTTVA
jgi:hypothetical protein